MRDRGLIYIGLLIFLAVVTLPFSYNLAAGKTSGPPELKLPENEKQCVAPVEYMKSSHMQLLQDWRDNKVRKNIRAHTTPDGRSFNIALTGTCLTQCHTSKADFCDRCHKYMGVEGPSCMECHIDPAVSAGHSPALKENVE
jgi:hypothetical protein